MIETAFTGRLGGDLELKTSKAGKPFASASVAITGSGEETTWARVVAFGQVAERAAAELHRGDACYVEGRLTVERWTGKDGQERLDLSVVASTLAPAAIGLRRPAKPRASPSRPVAALAPDPRAASETPFFEDDIGF